MRGKVLLNRQSIRGSSSVRQRSSIIGQDDPLAAGANASTTTAPPLTASGHYHDRPRRSAELTHSVVPQSGHAASSLYSRPSYPPSNERDDHDVDFENQRAGEDPSGIFSSLKASTLLTASMGPRAADTRSFGDYETNGRTSSGYDNDRTSSLYDDVDGRTSGNTSAVDSLLATMTVTTEAATGNTEDVSENVEEASEAPEQENKDEDNVDDDLDEKKLTEDTYSFMVSSPVASLPFWISIIVASLQFITFFLLAFSLVDFKDRANPFKIPVAVSTPVRMAQVVAILLSVVATPSDIHSALDLARDGFRNNQQLQSAFENATWSKFVLSIVLRVFLGVVGMILMFALIVSAETVIDLLLNFTALEFVTLIDEAFFLFAKEGFLGASCESQAAQIEETTYKAPTRPCSNRILKYSVTAMFLVGYFIGWTVVAKKQQSASMLCSTILVQFGDDHQPEIGTFAGIYDKQVNPDARLFDSMRVSYVQRGYAIGSGGSFSYCGSLNAWTFRWPLENHGGNNTAIVIPAAPLDHVNGPTYNNNNNIFHHNQGDKGYSTKTSDINSMPPPGQRRRWLKSSKKAKKVDQSHTSDGGDGACDWRARSSETDTFDLTTTIESPWYIQDENGREILLEPVVISCIDCQGIDDCSGRGACENGICSCEDGWSGLRCEFPEPCRSLSMDQRFGEFPGARKSPSDYELLLDGKGKPVYSSNRAIYVGLSDSDAAEQVPKRKFTVVDTEDDGKPPDEERSLTTQKVSGSLTIVFFTGRRWAAAFIENLLDVAALRTGIGKEETMAILADYFRDDFHGYWSNYTAEYLSSPMDIAQAGDAMSPLYVQWYWVERRPNRKSTGVEVQAPNLALAVDASFLCTKCDINANPCRYDGWCSIEGICQCAPGSQGKLCEVAPVGDGLCHPFYNSAEYNYDQGDCCESTCVSTSEFQCGYDPDGAMFLGYPWCSLEPGQWYSQGDKIVGEHISGAGASVALSNQGSILAVSEPGKQRVILYDKDGSKWVERDGPYELDMERGYDTTINGLSMASVPSRGHLLKSGSQLVPVLMVYTESDFRGTAPLIYCTTRGCETKEQFQGATSIAISGDGSRIVLGNGRISLQKDPWPRNNTEVEVVDVNHENLDGVYRLHGGIVSHNADARFDPLSVANYVSVNDGSDCDPLTLLRSVSLSHDASILAVEVGEWIGCEDSDWGPRPQLETEDGGANSRPTEGNTSSGRPQGGRPQGEQGGGSNGRPQGEYSGGNRPNGGSDGTGRPQSEEGGGRPTMKRTGGNSRRHLQRPNIIEGTPGSYGRPQIEGGVDSTGKPQTDDISTVYSSIYLHTSVYTFHWSGTDYINPSLVATGRTTLAHKRPTFAMSDNGRVVVAGTGPCTHGVFSWDGGSWSERGKLISNEDPCQHATYSISSDGSTIVIGTDTGGVEVYRWNGESLIPAGQGFESGANHSTALSGDGNALAIGLPMSQEKSAGSTLVYSSPPETIPKNQSLLRLQVAPYTNETKWALQSTRTDETLTLGEASLWALATTTEGIAVEKDDCLMLTIQVSNHSCSEMASYGKSCETWHPILEDPRFDVFVDGKRLAGSSLQSDKGRLSGVCEGEHRYPPRRISVGKCNLCSEGQELIQIATSTCYPSEAWRLENSNGQSLLSFDSTEQSTSEDMFGYQWESVCLSLEDDCYAFSTSTSTDIQEMAPLQFTQYNRTKETYFSWAGGYFLYVGDQLLAGGRYSKRPTPPVVQFGKCNDASSSMPTTPPYLAPSSFVDPPLALP